MKIRQAKKIIKNIIIYKNYELRRSIKIYN